MQKNLLTLTFCLLPFMGMGSAYQMNLQGLRQVAMGGSGTAISWDASSIFYNTAGLADLDRFQLYVAGFSPTRSTRYVQSPGLYIANSHATTQYPINVYFGGPVAYKSRVNLGLGIYSPFGHRIAWDADWRGRYLSQEMRMNTLFFQPTISYRLHSQLSLGLGLIYATGSVEMSQALPVQNQAGEEGSASLSTRGRGYGFQAGVQWKPTSRLHLGLTYRSQVNMKSTNGLAQFRVPQSLSSQFPTTSYDTRLPLPMVASLGLGVQASARLHLQADLNFTGWAAFRELNIDFKENTGMLKDLRSPREFRNTLSLHLGGHYKLSDRVSLMLGGALEPSPVKDGRVSPEFPDAHQGLVSGGLSYRPHRKITALLALEYRYGLSREGSFDPAGFQGTYQTTVLTPGLGLSYDF